LNEISNLPPSVRGNTDVPFYQNVQMLMQKALLMEWDLVKGKAYAA